MAPSTSNLKQLLEYQSKCERLEMFDGQGQLVLIVTQFVIKLSSKDDEIIILLKSLEDSAKLCRSYNRHSEEDRQFSTLFWDFVAQLQLFFKVPKIKSNSKPNELVAAFIDILLEILEEILHLQPYFIHGLNKEFILVVKKELKFLIIFLGDAPSQHTELETTKNVLSDIEVVANEVGSFLYSFFFSKERISLAGMNKSLSDLLRNVELVKESINKHCVTVANLWQSDMTPKTATVSLSFVDSVLDYIDDLVHRNDDMIVDLKDQIITIHQNLMNLNNGIKELEIKRHQEREEFSMRLINIAYEVEYIINSFSPVSYITLRLLQVTGKIKPMRMRLRELKKNDARVLKHSKYPTQHISMRGRIGNECLVGLHDTAGRIGNECLVGLHDTATEICEQLLRGTRRLQIISISGMSVTGKTTLANKLYNHSLIRYHFDKMAWCVVSQTDQRRNMLIDILMSTSTRKRETILNMGDDDLSQELYKCLKGIRYIIFMDDIRSANALDGIIKFFPDGNRGSRILLTSQIMDLAMMASYSLNNYPVRSLTEDEFWDLLQMNVFTTRTCPPDLVDVGKNIARNCGGLPITVLMIASLLKNLERKRSLWMEIAENIISTKANAYMNAVELSYKYLPMHLKPCFLYFGVFEKEREIPVQKLIMLWVAERFTGKVKNKSSEDVAEEYLMDLIDRRILLVAKRSYDGGVESCTIPGAVHDLCLKLAEKDNFMKAIKGQLSIYEQHHRLCIPSHSIPSFSRPFGLHIHSLLGHLPDPSAFIFSSLKHLKVLVLTTIDLSLYDLKGNEVLAFLKFLAVSSIPSSIEIFKNLEFLFVDNKEIVEIPAILLNMVKLRCVQFNGAQFSESLRQAVHVESFQMSNIQNLSSIFIYDENDEKILGFFPHLRILKCNFLAFWDSSVNSYRYPALDFLSQLESLDVSIQLTCELDDISPALISLPENLRKLTLCNFDISSKLMTLIGVFPNLEVLKLRYDTTGGKQWDTSECEFFQLKYLELDEVQINHWNASRRCFPSLERLVLQNCNLLEEIPSSIGDVPTLQKIEVYGCAKSLRHSAYVIGKEQREYWGNDSLDVSISES